MENLLVIFFVILELTGACLYLIGMLTVLGAAFETHIAWGFLCLFVSPLGTLLFVLFNPKRGFKPLLLQVSGAFLLGITLALMQNKL